MRLAALAVASVALAGPVLAQPSVSEPITGNLGGRGSVFASVGYLRTDGIYGEVPQMGGSSATEALTLRLGGEFVALRSRGGAAGAVGLALQAADISLGDGAFDSGFRPQSAELYVRGTAPVGPVTLGATTGFVLDISPTFDDGDFPNTDQQDAVRLGVGASIPAGAVRVEAGLEYVATFEGSTQIPVTTQGGPTGEVLESVFDYGDARTGYLGAVLPVSPSVEVGLRAVVASTTQITSSLDGVESPVLVDGRDALSLVPHVRFAPEGSAFSAVLSAEALAGYVDEHVRYGFTVTGDNAYKVRIPVTLAVRYGF